MSSEDSVEWIRSPEVVSVLTAQGTGWGLYPERRLRDGLRNGLIAARARVANLTSRGRVLQETHFDIPAQFWSGDSTNSVFNLRGDKFTSRAIKSGYSHVELIGLAFDKEQLMDFANVKDAPAPKLAPDAAGAGGRRPDAEKWGNFSAAMLAYAHDKGIDPDWSAGQLYEAVADYAMERAKEVPHKSNVTKALSLALRWAKGIDSPKNED